MKGKTIWAIVAGVIFTIVVTTVVDMILHAAHVYPSLETPLDNRLSAIATSYRLLVGIAAGWLTARLAPMDPMRHAMLLGYVGVVLGLVGVAATWNLGIGPHWYPIALVVLAIPQSWLGGKLFTSRES